MISSFALGVAVPRPTFAPLVDNAVPTTSVVAVATPTVMPPLLELILYGPVTERIPTAPTAGMNTSLEKNAVPINLDSLLTLSAVCATPTSPTSRSASPVSYTHLTLPTSDLV